MPESLAAARQQAGSIMTTSRLLTTFDDWREQGKQIVLATVFEPDEE